MSRHERPDRGEHFKGASLDGLNLHLRKIGRADAGDVNACQPLTWIFIEFEADDDHFGRNRARSELVDGSVRRVVLRLPHQLGNLHGVRRSDLALSTW